MKKRTRVLGIIPARGRSKRVPRKNIRLLGGKHLIGHTIEVALQTQIIDRLIVSTDNEEIAAVARQYGAEVPFTRPSSLATDTTADQPVFCHALDWLKKNENYVPDIVLNLRPTTPFKTSAIIERVVEKIEKTKADVVRTVSLVEGVYHPYWMYRVSKDGWAESFINDISISDYHQSQLLPPAYRLNGVVDAIRKNVIDAGGFLDSQKMSIVVIPEGLSIDIDTEFDFKLAEMILNLGEKDGIQV
jgi:CMP-N,N'-diacetyllegionaminic acid synthase